MFSFLPNHEPVRLSLTGETVMLVQSFSALEPVAFEWTFHIFDSVDNVMVYQFFVLDTDTATTVAL